MTTRLLIRDSEIEHGEGIDCIGALLMTSRRARTERVAELLGYGSAAAFCHAFAGAGLPSPGNVRRVVDELA